MPDDWVLLPAVARRLVEFLRIEGLLDIGVVSLGPYEQDEDRQREFVATVRDSPVLSKLVGAAVTEDVVSTLRQSTMRDLLRAARNDAETFLVAATTLDDLFTMSLAANRSPRTVPAPGVELARDKVDVHQSAPVPVSDLPITEDHGPAKRTAPPAARDKMTIPPQVVRDTIGFLPTEVRRAVGELSDDRWQTLWSLLPLRHSSREAILSACGGDLSAVRRFICGATSDQLAQLPQFGPASLQAVRLAMREAIAELGSSFNGPPESAPQLTSLLDPEQRAALAEMTPAEWVRILGDLPLRPRNALLRFHGNEEEVRQFLLAASEDDLAAVPNLGTNAPAQLRLLLGDALVVYIQANATRPDQMGPPSFGPSPASLDLIDPPVAPDGANLIRGDDPRFHDLLGRSRDLAVMLTEMPPEQAHRLVALVRDRLALLAATTFEQEATALLAAAASLAPDHPRVVAMTARYGLSGAEPSTMDDIAQVLNVSRARVGQISQKLGRSLPTVRVWAPLADQVLQLVEGVIPCSLDDLNDALQGAGLTAVTWEASALIAAAALTGRVLDLQEHDGFVVASEDASVLRSIHITARRISDRNGAAAVPQVVAELHDIPRATPGLVQEFLVTRPDITWLSRDWFWSEHGARRNRLVNTSQRILVVHQPQSLTKMVEGIGRNYTWRNSTGGAARAELQVPPIEMVRAFYASHPSFITDHAGRISLAQPVDMEILGPEKLTLVGILRAQPWPAMTRTDLIDACVAEGMKSSTAQVFLTYAECIENFGHNVWGLRGADVPEGAIVDLQRSSRVKSRAFDRGWREGATQAGRPWFSQRLTPSLLHSGVLASRWSANLDEESQLTIIDGTDGEPTGALRRTGHFTYGLSKLIRKNRPAVGDFLRIVLYKEDGYAVAELGGDELADAPEDWS